MVDEYVVEIAKNLALKIVLLDDGKVFVEFNGKKCFTTYNYLLAVAKTLIEVANKSINNLHANLFAKKLKRE